jgi:hypothetical protein
LFGLNFFGIFLMSGDSFVLEGVWGIRQGLMIDFLKKEDVPMNKDLGDSHFNWLIDNDL